MLNICSKIHINCVEIFIKNSKIRVSCYEGLNKGKLFDGCFAKNFLNMYCL